MTHRTEVIDLVRLRFLNDADDVGGISEVTIMHLEFYIRLMLIFIKMIYTFCIKKRTPSLYTMYHVSFVEKKFSKIGAVLTGYSCDECNFHNVWGILI